MSLFYPSSPLPSPPLSAVSGIPHTGSHLTAPLCQAALNLDLFEPLSPPTVHSPPDAEMYLRTSLHCHSLSQWKLQSWDYSSVSVFSLFWPFSFTLILIYLQYLLKLQYSIYFCGGVTVGNMSMMLLANGYIWSDFDLSCLACDYCL